MAVVINGTTGVSGVDGSAGTPSYQGTDSNTGIFFPAADTIAFGEGGAEAMRINSSANVLIGTTTSPSSAEVPLVVARGSGSYIQVTKTNATAGGAAIGTTGSSIFMFTHTGAVGAETYTSVFELAKDKSLALQGATSQSGAGITFPATQSASTNANTLDDYEEGTWTPNVIHSSSNNSTWTTKNGYYTKVGRLVTAWFVCDGGTSGTSGSTLQVTGLPFALGTISGAVTWGIWSTNGTVRNGGFVQSSSGSTTMNMYNGGGDISEQQTYGSGCITYFV